MNYAVLTLAYLIPLGIVGWQTFFFLKDGRWIALSLISPLQWINCRWANHPNDWIGLHQLLDFVPLSFGTFVGLLLVFHFISRNEGQLNE